MLNVGRGRIAGRDTKNLAKNFYLDVFRHSHASRNLDLRVTRYVGESFQAFNDDQEFFEPAPNQLPLPLQSLRKCPQGGEFFLVSLPTLQTVLLIMQHLLELSKPLPHLRVLFLAPYEGLK
jgi:hypothetical protein